MKYSGYKSHWFNPKRLPITRGGPPPDVECPLQCGYCVSFSDCLDCDLAAVVLGGLESIKGSVIAAFILGFAETAVIYLVPGGGFLRGAVSLSVMVVVLMVRPEGLFGVLFEEERL